MKALSQWFRRMNSVWLRLGVVGGTALVIGAAFWFTWQFVEPAPPGRFVMATGASDGAYHRYGLALKDVVAEQGFTLELVNTRGSVDNLHRLAAREVDIAFVQSGLASEYASTTLEGLASLFFEPLWIFTRGELPRPRLSSLAGKRIATGSDGSGSQAISETLLEDAGLFNTGIEMRPLGGIAAADALIAGEVDAVFMVSDVNAPAVRRLFDAPGIGPLDLERAPALARRHAWLQNILVPAGLIDLAQDQPPTDVRLVGVAATLIAQKDLHPAVVDLMMQASTRVFSSDTLFSKAGRFPSSDYLDFPQSNEALRYLTYGTPFLQRYLPFWAANLIDRLKVLALPLLALLLPLTRVLPPAWEWTVRKKIFHWYRDVQRIDVQSRDDPSAANLQTCLAALARIEDEVRGIEVPLGYAHELYALRLHIDLLHQQIERRLSAARFSSDDSAHELRR